MKALLSIVAFFGVVGSWWFWWSHLLTWIPAALLYFPMLKKLQSDSPLMIMAAIPHDRIVGMSSEAVTWINKNGHALVMWGAATEMSKHIKTLLAFAFFSILITAFRHSWWWLAEFIPLSGVMLSLHDGFRPISQEKLSENAASGRDPFIATEIVPLFKEIVERDISRIMGRK
jgi:hypothetical protein